MDKNHLILPIFDKYFIFSNKQYDYLKFKNALLSGIIYSENLPENILSNKSITSVESIINASASYFPA
jgi:ubiquinol-cytochrome c reductase cytochrome b subunit